MLSHHRGWAPRGAHQAGTLAIAEARLPVTHRGDARTLRRLVWTPPSFPRGSSSRATLPGNAAGDIARCAHDGCARRHLARPGWHRIAVRSLVLESSAHLRCRARAVLLSQKRFRSSRVIVTPHRLHRLGGRLVSVPTRSRPARASVHRVKGPACVRRAGLPPEARVAYQIVRNLGGRSSIRRNRPFHVSLYRIGSLLFCHAGTALLPRQAERGAPHCRSGDWTPRQGRTLSWGGSACTLLPPATTPIGAAIQHCMCCSGGRFCIGSLDAYRPGNRATCGR